MQRTDLQLSVCSPPVIEHPVWQMAAMMTVNTENINTSPRGPARSKQYSTNSQLAKPFESPSKRLLYNSDGSQKVRSKSGSPRGDGPGAPDWHLHNQIRSSPLAPVGANGRATARPYQDTAVTATPSSLSSLKRTGSKTAGLRLHWDDVASTSSRQSARSPLHLETARTSCEQDSETRHQLAFLSAQDLSIPDLRDAEIVSLLSISDAVVDRCSRVIVSRMH